MAIYREQKGLTIIELLIAMVLAIILTSAAYRTFSSQQKVYTVQEQVTEMQQALRSTMMTMVREIRMAGCIDPDDRDGFEGNDIDTDVPYDSDTSPFSNGDNERIEEATNTSICFEADVDDDNATETIRYFIDANGQLVRQCWQWNGATWQPDGNPQLFPEHFAGIFLEYTFEDGERGVPGFQGDGTDDREDIRMVHLTLVARTLKEDPEYRDGLNISGSASDGTCRTRTISANIRVRNMGMSGL